MWILPEDIRIVEGQDKDWAGIYNKHQFVKLKKEIQEELNKVDEGLSAWTSPPKPEKEKVETEETLDPNRSD